jgi:hypothetical protein
MKIKYLNPLIALLAMALPLTFIACTVDLEPEPEPPKLYMVGIESRWETGAATAATFNEARLWIDGVKQELETKTYVTGGNEILADSEAKGVVVASNGDVYVIGRISMSTPGNYATCGYWKNGEFFPLYERLSTNHGFVYGYAMHDDDLYVCGNTYTAANAFYKPTFWKVGPDGNIQQIDITTGVSGTQRHCFGIGVSGSDVYAAFHDTAAGMARIYKAPLSDLNNGVITDLPKPDGNTSAVTVTNLWVSGDSVYVSGSLATSPARPLLWKDGELQEFNYDTSVLGNINRGCVYSGKVYMAGHKGTTTTTTAQLWVDDNDPQILVDINASNNIIPTVARCVFVDDSGVYVGGYNLIDGNTALSRSPLLWKNGAVKRYPTGGVGASVEAILRK